MVRVFDKFGEEEIFINEKKLQSQLFASISLGDVDKAKQAIVRGAKLNYTDSSGKTPLHLAIYSNNEEMIKLLLKHGADVDYTDSSGKTPLDAAIFKKT
ncbi:ankyrin repeat-containing protein 09 [Orientia tsutsugamushi]|uniref:Ankyrin repeat-containing protein 09 n=1 Tax=Orientia tsutsugamushi TaxID=784 RepID=A0A2R8EZ74_ORITS|nr:ankyrin repeat domain-containing protein [Orientia tsutsugamushi]SPM44470.1 ankyrin repeat-containing protein 09 [Orientia tsutsugamushi]